MDKLIYGKENQIIFNNMAEKEEAIEFLRNRNKSGYVEHNETAGAYASEYRWKFGVNEKLPECLERQLTDGRRINCKELFDEVYGE